MARFLLPLGRVRLKDRRQGVKGLPCQGQGEQKGQAFAPAPLSEFQATRSSLLTHHLLLQFPPDTSQSDPAQE